MATEIDAFPEAVQRFLAHLREVRRCSPATLTAYRSDLTQFASFVGDGDPDLIVRRVTPDDVRAWVASMQALSPTTVCRRLSALSAFFRTGQLLGYAERNPVAQVERPRTNAKLMPALNGDQVRALLNAACSDSERAVILTFATTGIRRAELCGLRIGDVELEGRLIRVRGKGGKERAVLVTQELEHALRLHLRRRGEASPAAPLFVGRARRALSFTTLQRWFHRWVDEAGLAGKGYTLHSLRRFAATRWMQNGLNIRQIQILLGHSSPETTARYLSYDFAEVAKALDSLLPPIEEHVVGGAAGSADARHAPTEADAASAHEGHRPGLSQEAVAPGDVLAGLVRMLALAGAGTTPAASPAGQEEPGRVMIESSTEPLTDG